VQEDTLKIFRHEVTVCIFYSAQEKQAEHFPQKVAVTVISSSEQEGTGIRVCCKFPRVNLLHDFLPVCKKRNAAENIPKETCFMNFYQCAGRYIYAGNIPEGRFRMRSFLFYLLHGEGPPPPPPGLF
jgi:hypothetical protein